MNNEYESLGFGRLLTTITKKRWYNYVFEFQKTRQMINVDTMNIDKFVILLYIDRESLNIYEIMCRKRNIFPLLIPTCDTYERILK